MTERWRWKGVKDRLDSTSHFTTDYSLYNCLIKAILLSHLCYKLGERAGRKRKFEISESVTESELGHCANDADLGNQRLPDSPNKR